MDPKKYKSISRRISKKFNIKILYAAENGSRAYGLNSYQSDYDLRIIYIHKSNSFYSEYLDSSMSKKKKFNLDLMNIDKIEQETITGCFNEKDGSKIDWHGWDITKAIKHLFEMNASLVEWLYSDIIYYNDINFDFLSNSRELIVGQSRLYPLIKHYKGMAKSFYYDYIHDEKQVRIKKYMVAVQSCLIIEWLLNCKLNSKYFIQTNLNKILKNDLKSVLDKKLFDFIELYILIRKSIDKNLEITRAPIIDKWLIKRIFNSDKEYGAIETNEKNTNRSIQKYNKFLYNCFEKIFLKNFKTNFQ